MCIVLISHSGDDFLAVPELAVNPLLDRIVSLFGNGKNEVNFRQFVDVLDIFRPESTSWHPDQDKQDKAKAALREKKLRCLFGASCNCAFVSLDRINNSHPSLVLFRIYDVNNDGFIDSTDLFEVLKTMVGAHVNAEDLATIVKRTIEEADQLDHDGKISFAEFDMASGDWSAIRVSSRRLYPT